MRSVQSTKISRQISPLAQNNERVENKLMSITLYKVLKNLTTRFVKFWQN